MIISICLPPRLYPLQAEFVWNSCICWALSYSVCDFLHNWLQATGTLWYQALYKKKYLSSYHFVRWQIIRPHVWSTCWVWCCKSMVNCLPYDHIMSYHDGFPAKSGLEYGNEFIQEQKYRVSSIDMFRFSEDNKKYRRFLRGSKLREILENERIIILKY